MAETRREGFRCDACGTDFDTEEELKAHAKEDHGM